MSKTKDHYYFFCLPCCLLQDLAKELLEIFTARKMGKVFFSNSGSEANDSQVPFLHFYSYIFNEKFINFFPTRKEKRSGKYKTLKYGHSVSNWTECNCTSVGYLLSVGVDHTWNITCQFTLQCVQLLLWNQMNNVTS